MKTTAYYEGFCLSPTVRKIVSSYWYFTSFLSPVVLWPKPSFKEINNVKVSGGQSIHIKAYFFLRYYGVIKSQLYMTLLFWKSVFEGLMYAAPGGSNKIQNKNNLFFSWIQSRPVHCFVADVKDPVLCVKHFAHFMARNIQLQQDSRADVSLYKIG